MPAIISAAPGPLWPRPARRGIFWWVALSGLIRLYTSQYEVAENKVCLYDAFFPFFGTMIVEEYIAYLRTNLTPDRT